MIAITGATGHLGRLVIAQLLEKVTADQVTALVRNPGKAADLSAAGVRVRTADYRQPETLAPALAGVDKLLLISSSELGQRIPQHRNVIEAAKQAGVGLLAYTSVLHADSSPLGLASSVEAAGAPIELGRMATWGISASPVILGRAPSSPPGA